MIDVWGADHGGYVRRMQAAVKAVSENAATLEIVLCQIVHIMRGGEPVRMSKRAGSFVTLRDLLDEVGRDAVRFTMLTRKADAQMEFDLDQGGADPRQPGVLRAVRARPLPLGAARRGRACSAADAVTDAALAGVAQDPGAWTAWPPSRSWR